MCVLGSPLFLFEQVQKKCLLIWLWAKTYTSTSFRKSGGVASISQLYLDAETRRRSHGSKVSVSAAGLFNSCLTQPVQVVEGQLEPLCVSPVFPSAFVARWSLKMERVVMKLNWLDDARCLLPSVFIWLIRG